MYLKDYIVETKHTRRSKLNKEHTYTRKKRISLFRCDCCDNCFERPRGTMDPKRLSNNYFHVCGKCDAKKFAQKKGVERKRVWDMSASSDIPIAKL